MKASIMLISQKNYWLTLLVLLLLVNEYNMQWLAAVFVGNFSIIGGLKDAYQYFGMDGYLFFTATRIPPYFMLWIMVVVMKKKQTPAIGAIAWTGLVGVAGMIAWVDWSIVVTYYLDVHVSSTSAIGFLVAPILAILSGLAGGLFGYLSYLICIRKRNVTSNLSPK